MSTSTITPTSITINARIAKPADHVWKHWTEPKHIMNWNAASDDWHCPKAENDLRVGGKFSSRMEARDGSMGFDFGGTYTAVVPHEKIAYTMEDGRRCGVLFAKDGDATKATVTFDAETDNTVEMQSGGWQAILDRFKAYSEQQG
ncbi:MAG: SRPBCC family protein [Flavobacteriales bacterium]